MSKIEGRCQVKGCENEYNYIFITHEDGDHYMCQSCKEKYLDKEEDDV